MNKIPINSESNGEKIAHTQLSDSDDKESLIWCQWISFFFFPNSLQKLQHIDSIYLWIVCDVWRPQEKKKKQKTHRILLETESYRLRCDVMRTCSLLTKWFVLVKRVAKRIKAPIQSFKHNMFVNDFGFSSYISRHRIHLCGALNIEMVDANNRWNLIVTFLMRREKFIIILASTVFCIFYGCSLLCRDSSYHYYAQCFEC